MSDLPVPLDPSAQHLAVLQQAFDSLGNGLHGNTATIVVQGGAKICVNSDLLLFHSPFFRALLGSIAPLSSSLNATLSIPDASASALLALEGLLANGSSKCESKAAEVEGLAKLLGVQQMKVTGQDSSTVIPATILPAAMFREASFPFFTIQLILKKTHFLSWGLLGNILYMYIGNIFYSEQALL